MPDLLTLEKLSGGYNQAEVLHDVDLRIAEGESVALVGPNGAGKSTLLKIISGLLAARRGSFSVSGKRADRWSAARLVAGGLVHVPEGRQVFPGVTVAENLWLGGYAKPLERTRRREEVLSLFPRLAERLTQRAETLSGGEQQMLAIGRGLMAGPRLLMIDEPSLGLAPVIIDTLTEALIAIRQKLHVALLLVEQNALLSRQVCDRTYIIVNGAIARISDSELEHEEMMRLYGGQV